MGARRIVKKAGVNKASVKKASVKKAKTPVEPILERWLTRRLLGAVMVLGSLGGLLGFAVWQLAQPNTLPIKQVQVKGEFRYLDKQSLYKKIAGLASAGFFNVDVQAVKQAAEAMPWVDTASVRRIWPDILRIDIREQIPLARWQGGGMVNRHGDVVLVTTTDALHGLPLFSGPEGTAKTLAKRYQLLSLALAKADLVIETLTLSNRRAWQVSLNNNMKLLLGRATQDTQLPRFIQAYGSDLLEKRERIQSVDLRYTNGFAVRWQTQAG